MPIQDLLYRCPRCGHDPLTGRKGKAKCPGCGTRFEQGRDSVIVVRPPEGPSEHASASSLLGDVERMGGPGAGHESLFREAKIRFGRVEGHDVIRFRGAVLGFSERISWKGVGLIRLEADALTFTPDPGPEGAPEGVSCALGDLRSVQISSNSLQVGLDGGQMYQFGFVEDSAKRWEDLVCLALRRFYGQGGHSITEFRPRIIVMPDAESRAGRSR